MINRCAYGLAMLFVIILCAGCQSHGKWWDSKWPFVDKVDREYQPEADKTDQERQSEDRKRVRRYDFHQSGHHRLAVDNKRSFIRLKSLEYRKPVDGTWPRMNGLLEKSLELLHLYEGGGNGEELFFFAAVVTYDNEDDFEQIREALRDPIAFDKAQIERGEHNWFTDNLAYGALPSGSDIVVWQGYAEGVKADESVGIELAKFENASRGKTVDPATTLGIKDGKYYYLKMFLFEETGHQELRKFLKKVDGESSLNKVLMDVVKHGSEGEWVAAIRVVGAHAVDRHI